MKSGIIMGRKKNLVSTVLSFVFVFLLLFSMPSKAYAANDEVYAGGMTFGAKLYTEGVLISGFADVVSIGQSSCPAKEAGLKENDIISKIDGTEVTSLDELFSVLNKGKESVLISVKRGSEELTFSVVPKKSDEDGKMRIGILGRDTAAGIGTVTFIVPDTLAFAGLGHGICNTNTGDLLPLKRGTSQPVKISGVKRGESGSPGEIQGSFDLGKTGSIIKNCESGVYGVFTSPPAGLDCTVYKTAAKGEIELGAATILSAIDSETPVCYSIEIISLDAKGATSDSFSIKVTDERLIEKTGGIIQGMSGSPIIQNGKLIGAVTHVMVNDPKKGYGISIERMLSDMPKIIS